MNWTPVDVDDATGAVYVTVALIAGTALVSGPLVGAVDFTHERAGTFSPGSGSADLAVLSTPDRARLDRGSFGAGAYYLQVPDAEVRVEAVTGQPILAYKIRIPDLGYTRSTVHFLDAETQGRLTVSIEKDALAPEEIDRDSYSGEIVVLVRTDGGEDVLYRGPVTVAVTGKNGPARSLRPLA